MNVEQARFNMIEQQIRPWDVLDQNVLDLLYVVKREEFVPPVYRSLAFSDLEIPIGAGERMMAPKLEARILQEVAPKKTDRILEIGTGSGYLTALLAAMGAHVYTVEIDPGLKASAEAALARNGVRNVTVELGDGARGWPKHGPYDVIVLTGSEPVLAEAFAQSLRVGGRLFAVVGDAPVMEARLVTRVAESAVSATTLFETVVAPLRNAPQPERFAF
ncbi:MAG: protein-L-isoaspartate O-methyltransferase [Burkholderiales bacterium]|jgi:protein-L-isoaspartate(D-aspartate) O-methyltransferase|nr:protein-L-isoaspartate O-methyltransferase [Burkholderiales bacterium]